MKSEARLRQLERLKLTRRRQQWKREVVQVAEIQVGPTWHEFMAEVRRISMAGIMPTQERFDLAKPAVWQSANELCARFGVTWDEMAAMVDLTPRRGEP
jgi:hypothetical protein